MVSLAMQYGIHPGPDSLLEPLALIVAGACLGAMLLPLTRFLVTHTRGAWRVRGAERRRLRAAATAELRSRAMMSELCPFGWHAQITLLASYAHCAHAADAADPDAADLDGGSAAPPATVALDWTELSAPDGRPAVVRRVWADSVGEALEKMVADRRTDETLEQIEHGAVADGARWPDL